MTCEILTLDSGQISDLLFNYEIKFPVLEVNLKLPIIVVLVYIYNKYSESEQDNLSQNYASTIPGYIEKIILYAIKNNSNKFIKTLQEKNNFNFFIENLFKNLDIDSVREILFQILLIKIFPLENNASEEIQYKEFIHNKINIINELFNNLKDNQSSEGAEDNKIKVGCSEKIKNSLLIIIKLLKYLFLLKQSESEQLLQEIISKKNLEIIESLILEKSDCKMSDSDNQINSIDLKIKIRYGLYFLFNLIQTTILPIRVEDTTGKEVISSSLFNDEIFMSGLIKSEENFVHENPNVSHSGENLIESLGKNNPKILKSIPNLFSEINDSTKLYLTEYIFKIFPDLFEILKKVKILYISKPEAEKIKSLINSTYTATSQEYLIFLDIFIALLELKNEFFLKYLKNSIFIFTTLIDDLLFYQNNEFLHNKILRIFHLCLFDVFYNELIDPIVNCDIIRKIASNIDFKNFIDLENKKLSYKNSNSVNYSQLIRLLNYLYICLKNKEHNNDYQGTKDKQINSFENDMVMNDVDELLSLNLKSKCCITFDEFEYLEKYLSVYSSILSKDLLSDKIQSIEEIKHAGDEEIKIEKNCKKIN